MKNIVLLGAGLSATNLIKYLLDNSEQYDWHLDIGDIVPEIALRKVNGHPRGSAFEFTIYNTDLLNEKVKQADVVISFLPAKMHPAVATACLEHKTNMVTASYVSKEMKEMASEVEAAGLTWVPLFLSFKWPSVAYTLDILAWDWFFALSMLFATPVFRGGRLEITVRILMIVSGVLSLAGLIGVPLADMHVRNIGIIGYGMVAPVVFLLLGIVFGRTQHVRDFGRR